jgi:photosystem II stability/assembly factor-like uncharacterized protein
MVTRTSRRLTASIAPLPRFVAAAALVAIAATADAQWTQLPAPGGWIKGLAVAPTDPSIVFAGADRGGLYRSTDSGGSWARTAVAEIGRDTVNTIAIDPVDKAVAYVGTETRGIFKTTDGGAHWTAIDAGVPAPNSQLMSIQTIAVEGSNTAVLLAGGSTSSLDGNPSLLLSSNGGQSWAPVSAPDLAGIPIFAIAFGPGEIFAATGNKGVWVSEDGAASWTHVGNDTLDLTDIESIAVDTTTSPETLYAIDADGLFTATPGGSPAPVHSLAPGGSPAAVPCLKVSKWNVAIWLAIASYGFKYNREILIALENGELPVPPESALAATAPQVIYTSTLTAGVQESLDRGGTWAPANAGLAPVWIERLATPPGANGPLFAGADGSGVWRRDTGASPWRWASHGLSAPSVDAIAVDPANPATIYAGTEGGGVLKSSDGGASWGMAGFSTLVYNASDPHVAPLAVDPNATSTLYATTGDGTFKSTNGGASWSRLHLPNGFYPWVIVTTGSPSTTVWLAGYVGVYSSTNGGATWLPSDPTFTQRVLALAISRSSPQTMYAATDCCGVYKTTNLGASWGAVNNDGGSGFLANGRVSALAVDPTSADIVYAGVDGHAVWKTTDGGASWHNLTDGLYDEVGLVYATLGAILIDPAHPSTLFADATGDSNYGHSFSGAFRSDDGGAHWSPLGTGLESLLMTTMILDPTNSSRLYAGAAGAGLFRYGPAATRTSELRIHLPHAR